MRFLTKQSLQGSRLWCTRGREGERFGSCSKGRLLHAINYELFLRTKNTYIHYIVQKMKKGLQLLVFDVFLELFT